MFRSVTGPLWANKVTLVLRINKSPFEEKKNSPPSVCWGKFTSAVHNSSQMVSVDKTHFQPVVEVNQPAALQVQFVGDADIRSSIGNWTVLSLQALILQREWNSFRFFSVSTACGIDKTMTLIWYCPKFLLMLYLFRHKYLKVIVRAAESSLDRGARRCIEVASHSCRRAVVTNLIECLRLRRRQATPRREKGFSPVTATILVI